MRSLTSSSCSSSSSSSSYSLASTSLNNRLETIFRKASELSILCEIDVCVIYYGPDGELKTWPEDRKIVRDMALKYSQLNEALRRKKSVNLYGFLKKKEEEDKTNLKKKAKKKVNDLKYPISDHYSPDQITQLIQSLELNVSTLQERLRFVESQKHKETKLDHQLSLNHQHLQTQSLNPSQFSLFMYNHGDNTLSKIPLSASNFNQDFSALLQESGLKNQLMQKELCGSDQNNNTFQLPCLSNTEHYSALPMVQESGVKNQLMQKELYGYEQNIYMGYNNMNSRNFQLPCVSNNNYTALPVVQESGVKNQLMQKELYGYDQNICLGNNNINTRKFRHPSISNTEHYSALPVVQESGLKNQLMQKELYGYEQNICMGNINSNNFQHPCISNTAHYSAVQGPVNNYRLNQLM